MDSENGQLLERLRGYAPRGYLDLAKVLSGTFIRNLLRGAFKLLVAGFLAVLIPLAVLMTLQVRWLASLEKTSAIAEKAWLDNYLEAVSSEIELFYRTQAERSLNMPAYLFTDRHQHKIYTFLRRNSPEGADYLSAIRYLDRE